MAGKQHSAAPSSSLLKWKKNKTSRSPLCLLVVVVFLALSLIYCIFASSPLYPLPLTHPILDVSSNPRADYSFVESLEKFLTSSASKVHPDDTIAAPTNQDIQRLEDAIWSTETRGLYEGPFLPLKVYVYRMPSKFTYDLLWLFRNTYRDTSNLTSNGSPVHRLIEQHSIDYWLWADADLIAPQSERLLTSVVRVDKQEEADLFYIPFFTTISFFLLETQQCKALYRVTP